MRRSPVILGLCLLSLAACDIPKSVGDTEGTTGSSDSGLDGTDGTETGIFGTDGWGSSGVTGWPGTASATSTTGGFPGTASATTAGTGGPIACGVDLAPVDGSELIWECECEGCLLSYDEISPQTADAFASGDVCSCLCGANGCGDVVGEGVTGSFPPGSGEGSSSDTEGAGTGGSTGGSSEFTYESCLEDGGVIVGDPGDGSVFEPDYVCPNGESPWGILEFVPGMPFPKNGGVCCGGTPGA